MNKSSTKSEFYLIMKLIFSALKFFFWASKYMLENFIDLNPRADKMSNQDMEGND